MTEAQLLALAAEEGFSDAAMVDTAEIPFDFSFRPYCEENLCGQYGANYSCPPDCGTCEEMKARITEKKQAIVLQTVWEISDYTDKAAIKNAKRTHNQASIHLLEKMRKDGYDCFMVGASGCGLCEKCTIRDALPCRFPELKYSCMSAYCIFVRKLCEQCGMEYNSSDGLLGFFGMIVF